MTYDKWKTTNQSDEFLGNQCLGEAETKPEDRMMTWVISAIRSPDEFLGNQCLGEAETKPEAHNVPITQSQDDRMRTALQLIASVTANDNKLVALIVATAKAGLADDNHDPMCEVLR